MICFFFINRLYSHAHLLDIDKYCCLFVVDSKHFSFVFFSLFFCTLLKKRTRDNSNNIFVHILAIYISILDNFTQSKEILKKKRKSDKNLRILDSYFPLFFLFSKCTYYFSFLIIISISFFFVLRISFKVSLILTPHFLTSNLKI